MNKKTHCHKGHPRTPENLQGRSCKLCAKDRWTERDTARRRQNTLTYLLAQLKRNARKRGQEFNLTEADFPELPTHCPVLGIRINYFGKDQGRKLWDKPSFDRTDYRLGYVSGNVVIMSQRANVLKNTATIPELLRVISYLRKIGRE